MMNQKPSLPRVFWAMNRIQTFTLQELELLRFGVAIRMIVKLLQEGGERG